MLLTGNDLKKTMVVKVQNIKEAKSSILNRRYPIYNQHPCSSATYNFRIREKQWHPLLDAKCIYSTWKVLCTSNTNMSYGNIWGYECTGMILGTRPKFRKSDRMFLHSQNDELVLDLTKRCYYCSLSKLGSHCLQPQPIPITLQKSPFFPSLSPMRKSIEKVYRNRCTLFFYHDNQYINTSTEPYPFFCQPISQVISISKYTAASFSNGLF